MNSMILLIKHAQSKEIKRALAVKMILSGKSYHEVKELLNVSHSFISEWKNQALFHGVESLRRQYQGRQGYLKAVEKEKTIEQLRAQDYLRLSDLKNYLQEQYDVVKEQKLRLKMKKKDRLIMEPQTIEPENFLCKNQRSGNTKNTIEFIKYLHYSRTWLEIGNILG